MKIVIIGPAHPLRGGLASYNERLATEFQQQGDDVCIYTFSLQYPSFLFPGTTQFSSEPAPAHLKIKVAINSINPFNWIKTGNEIRRQKPDIVIVRFWLPFMGPCLGTILRIIKKNKHSKIICIADNVIPHEKRFGDEGFTRYFLKPVDAFVTMSEKVLSDLRSFTKKPAKYVVHPLYDNFGKAVTVKEAKNYLNISQEQHLTVFFGFIRKYKGLDILLESIAVLQKQHPDFLKDHKFLIAGEFYEDQKPYEDQIQRLGIAEHLILHTHFIADSEVKYYLCAADVVIQPYRNATQSGVTPLAYHFEIPMIVTNVGGLPALVPDNIAGIVTEPDAASIADSILQFYRKGKDHFIPGLQKEKVKYSWVVMTNEIKSLVMFGN